MSNPRAERPHSRSDPRDVAELRNLKSDQPDLAAAADMQIELLGVQRRVQSRVALPTTALDRAKVERGAQKPLLRFEDIPINWGDFRLILRQTSDILRRFDNLDPQEHQRIQELARDGRELEGLAAVWYEAGAIDHPAPAGEDHTDTGMLDQVLLLAMRPFLARCAEAVLPLMDLSAWHKPRCPLCGGEPEFAFINPAAERLLICARCTGQWKYDPLACPYCENSDRTRITSFATRDGRYRIYACDVCHRYLKAYDGRAGGRPVLLAVDSVATLPLDAAAVQRGYQS